MNDIVFVPFEDDADLFKNFDATVLFDSSSKKKGISVSNLLNLVHKGQFKDGTLHEMLERCEFCLCSEEPPPRNAELEERILRLKSEQANEEYRSMTKSIFPQKNYNISIGREVKPVAAQVTAVINFVLTVGGSFCFAYKAVEYALPNPNIPAQVLMGIITSTVVALADLYFLARTI